MFPPNAQIHAVRPSAARLSKGHRDGTVSASTSRVMKKGERYPASSEGATPARTGCSALWLRDPRPAGSDRRSQLSHAGLPGPEDMPRTGDFRAETRNVPGKTGRRRSPGGALWNEKIRELKLTSTGSKFWFHYELTSGHGVNVLIAET